MDVFDLTRRLVEDYKNYTRSFIKIRDHAGCAGSPSADLHRLLITSYSRCIENIITFPKTT